MPSVQYYAMQPMVRATRLWMGRMAGRDQQAWLDFARRSGGMAERLARYPAGLRPQPATVAGVPGCWVRPASAPDSPVVLYLHGGGMVTSLAGPLKGLAVRVARASGLSVFAVDYRLLPATYPSAHDDCFAAYRGLLEQGRRVVLLGDSSGGVLALAVMLRAKAAGMPRPLSCVLLSPTVDYAFDDPGFLRSRDVFTDPRFVMATHRAYVAGHDTAGPDLSPVSQDLAGLPPIEVLVGEDELLRASADRLAGAARRHGVSVDVSYWPRMWHGWYVMADQLPEGARALVAAGRWIASHGQDDGDRQ